MFNFAAFKFSLLFDIITAVRVAIFPTLLAIRKDPTLLFRPNDISAVFMAHVWAGGFAEGTDTNGKPVKEGLITPNSQGVVLDIGAGHGHTIQYLNRSRVTRYVALEPNQLMHPKIRAAAHAAGFYESDGSFTILSCGAEDSASILKGLENTQADTIISVLTLCTIPNPSKSIHNLVRDVLKSNGQFLFYEHVLSHLPDVAWWQKFWAPVWQVAFDGCRLDRPTHLVFENLEVEIQNGEDGYRQGGRDSPWKERQVWGKPDEPEENLFWHRAGRFVKK
ncbi:hypothetical protein FA15DRAFT_516009 [Coprinopsis marcescibilis]|uniref:S-adenosyl-L-methionine-dependent methyltransferase n=1 Tax=Coprinopsis marcescibilis TaxID=230819 RepID=A0A5C3KQC4_COPMA|nr:hypothetical protein FA15DRAFT_516009 [Coprinopsis marcescibilis]